MLNATSHSFSLHANVLRLYLCLALSCRMHLLNVTVPVLFERIRATIKIVFIATFLWQNIKNLLFLLSVKDSIITLHLMCIYMYMDSKEWDEKKEWERKSECVCAKKQRRGHLYLLIVIIDNFRWLKKETLQFPFPAALPSFTNLSFAREPLTQRLRSEFPELDRNADV